MNGKIWVLGDAVVDLLPDGEGRVLQCPGGAPANVAVGVARLGGASGFIGRVGHDPFGRIGRGRRAHVGHQIRQWVVRFVPHRADHRLAAGGDGAGAGVGNAAGVPARAV